MKYIVLIAGIALSLSACTKNTFSMSTFVKNTSTDTISVQYWGANSDNTFVDVAPADSILLRADERAGKASDVAYSQGPGRPIVAIRRNQVLCTKDVTLKANWHFYLPNAANAYWVFEVNDSNF